MGRSQDDNQHTTPVSGPVIEPDDSVRGEPQAKNTVLGKNQVKAGKRQNFKGGDPDQDTHK